MSDEVTLRLPAPVLAQDHTTYDHMTGHDGGMWPAEHCGPFEPPAPDFPDEGRVGPGCGELIVEDQPVRKMRGWWLHADCARNAITAADVDEAWLLLADQVAARPHMFKASEIRTVLNAVTAIASRVALPGGAA